VAVYRLRTKFMIPETRIKLEVTRELVVYISRKQNSQLYSIEMEKNFLKISFSVDLHSIYLIFLFEGACQDAVHVRARFFK
jgi:hypothetical protein